MLAENKMIVQLFEVRTLEIREVTFRASPLSTSKEKKKRDQVMFNILNNLTMYIICNVL